MNNDLISRETAVAILRAKADMSIGEVKGAASFFNHCANMIEKLPAVDVKIDGNTSDGYHTFNELYHHRAVLFSVIVKAFPEQAWKSRKHHDGTMYDGMFIVGIDTPQGQATYHYDVDPYWEMFACRELDRAPEWDGHTPAEAISRIGTLKPVRHGMEKMMGDLISRSALLEALANGNLSDEFYDHGLDWENASRETQRAVEVQGAAIKRIINLAPAVNAVAARERAKWICHDDDIMPWYKCSFCGCEAFTKYKYCYNCNAEMEDDE